MSSAKNSAETSYVSKFYSGHRLHYKTCESDICYISLITLDKGNVTELSQSYQKLM